MPFKPGQSGNPAGKKKGTKEKFPRTAKRAVAGLLERYGANVTLMSKVLSDGLHAKPPASFPYLKLVIERHLGAPDQTVLVKTQVVLAPRD